MNSHHHALPGCTLERCFLFTSGMDNNTRTSALVILVVSCVKNEFKIGLVVKLSPKPKRSIKREANSSSSSTATTVNNMLEDFPENDLHGPPDPSGSRPGVLGQKHTRVLFNRL